MKPEITVLLRATCAVFFFVMVYVGYYVYKNQSKLFASMNKETSGERSYAVLTPFIIWAHVVVGLGLLALNLH